MNLPLGWPHESRPRFSSRLDRLQIRPRPDQETIDTMTGASFYTFRRSLAGSVAVAAMLAAVPASAQITGANTVAAPSPDTGSAGPGTPGAGTQQDIVVTGSRLRTSNVTSEAPITVVTSKQIEQSSSQTIEDVLRKIPSVGSEGNFSTTNNGANGSSCIDLRNLGIARTLVLVDGRRFVHTAYGTGNDCVDLDTIPISIVDRIEVLKDGASTIYGADAVAGVINIITKKNFVGTQVNLNGNITASGDDKQGDISGTTGFDFAQGRGNVVVTGRYLDRGPVRQADRDWAAPVVTGDNGLGQPYTFGSSVPVAGRFFGANSGSDNTVINGQLVPFQNKYNGAGGGNENINGRYDYGSDSYISDRQTQGNLAGNAHFDVNDHLTLYASAYYTHKNTQTQLSGQPVTGNPNNGQLFDIPQGNPFAEALGINEPLSSFRRTTDFGTRDTNTGSDSWQATAGARGNIVGNWDYDAYYTYGYSDTTIQLTNSINFTKLEQEQGFQSLNDGNVDDGIYNPAVCNPATGCVLGNVFGAGNASRQAINYATFTASANAYYQFRDVGATVTNNKLVNLPYGPIGLAVGFEHRGEQGSYHPDPIIQSGQSTAAAESPTGGGFNVSEVFGELTIPILKNVVAAKDLSADVSGRWSDYNTFGGVQNFKAGLNWSPTRDIRFRADIGTSTRQPAIVEAFGGDTLAFENGVDPCSNIASFGALAGVVSANCAKQRVPVGFVQNGDQIPTITGGNANLTPESARTYTIGTVLTPRWIRNFSATVDYYHTKIENQIQEVPVQFVENQCYTSVDLSSPQCANAGTRNASGNIQSAFGPYQNLGEVRTNGIDFDLNYLLKLGGGHILTFTNELTDLIGYTQQLVPNGPFVNVKGRLTPINTGLYPSGFPVLRDNFTGTYSKGGFSFSWTVRYIDGMQYNDGSTDFVTVTPALRFTKTNEVFYHDIVATYNWKKFQFIAGIDNLFDRTPPFALDGTENTAANVYDVLGRLFYAKLQVHF